MTSQRFATLYQRHAPAPISQAAGRTNSVLSPRDVAPFAPSGNLLLDSFSLGTEAMLLARLTPVGLPVGRLVAQAGQPVGSIYFPISGVFAETIWMADGAGVEVDLIGREGVSGLAALLGGDYGPLSVEVVVPGLFLQCSAQALSRLLVDAPALSGRLILYAQVISVVRAFSAGCQRFHPVSARLARWLLKLRDRIDGDEIALQQERLAHFLGVTRPTVSVALQQLEREGLIDCRRTRIRVLDHARLETVACECYQGVRQEFERLLAWPDGVTPPEAR